MIKSLTTLTLATLVGTSAFADTIRCGTGLDRENHRLENVELTVVANTANSWTAYRADGTEIKDAMAFKLSKGELAVSVRDNACFGTAGVLYVITPSTDGVFTSAARKTIQLFIGGKSLGTADCVISED